MGKSNVLILEAMSSRKGVMNKDVNAGLGTRTRIGTSLRARALEFFKRQGVRLPLLELGYLSALLKNQGHPVFYQSLDPNIPTALESVMEWIQKTNISTVVMHPALVDFKSEVAVAQILKKRLPSLTMGAVGPFASLYPNQLFETFDWVLAGEFEKVLLTQSLESLGGIHRIQGYVENLDELPFPDWSVFDWKSFSYRPMITGRPFLTLQGSRGCPMSCAKYCPYPTSQGKTWRTRSIPSILSEIQHCKTTYGMKGFLFRDPFFSMNRKRTRELAEAMIQSDFGIQWGCETRLDSLNQELITFLYKAGMRSLNLGIESEDENILASAGRKAFSKSLQEELVEFCCDLGIKVNAFFILGLMEDDEISMGKTIQHSKKLKTFSTQFTINTPLPGTEYHTEMEARNLLTDPDLEHYDNNTVVFSHPKLTAKTIHSFHEKAFLEYYFRPTYMGRFVRWKWRDFWEEFDLHGQ